MHPADLDDALCVTAIACLGAVELPAEVDLEDLEALGSQVVQSGDAGGMTRLPFAVDIALLQGSSGQLRAVSRLTNACARLSLCCMCISASA